MHDPQADTSRGHEFEKKKKWQMQRKCHSKGQNTEWWSHQTKGNLKLDQWYMVARHSILIPFSFVFLLLFFCWFSVCGREEGGAITQGLFPWIKSDQSKGNYHDKGQNTQWWSYQIKEQVKIEMNNTCLLSNSSVLVWFKGCFHKRWTTVIS